MQVERPSPLPPGDLARRLRAAIHATPIEYVKENRQRDPAIGFNGLKEDPFPVPIQMRELLHARPVRYVAYHRSDPSHFVLHDGQPIECTDVDKAPYGLWLELHAFLSEHATVRNRQADWLIVLTERGRNPAFVDRLYRQTFPSVGPSSFIKVQAKLTLLSMTLNQLPPDVARLFVASEFEPAGLSIRSEI